ncbi:MAG: histidine kinase [Reichenbachiella sp.]
MSKSKIYWLCQGFGWSFYGLLNFAIYFFIRGEFVQTELLVVLFQIGFYILSTHILRNVIKRYNWVLFSSLRLIPSIILSDLVLGLFNYVFLIGISYLMGILVLSVELKPVNFIFGVIGPAAMYFLWSLIYFAYHYFEQHNKSLQYEALIKDAELQHLRAQLNPHFIFNALNSIKALVDEDPEKSKHAITQLSSIFRNSLSAEKKRLVRLEEEMNTVHAYLGLEAIRYEERLQVKVDIEESTNYVEIPPMMIQTLVENGIKHGIAKLKEGGVIGLKTYSHMDNVHIQIRNTGVFLPSENIKEKGYGLENTKERLALIYREEAKFMIGNESDNVVLTEIVIPKTQKG